MSSGFSEANVEFPSPDDSRVGRRDFRSERRAAALAAVQKLGLLGTRDKTISGRVPSTLVAAAKSQSGIQSDSELLVYALSQVALEDNFVERLLARKGSVPRDVNLDI
jgi:hypothetical protein